jgi:hypothetical protein
MVHVRASCDIDPNAISPEFLDLTLRHLCSSPQACTKLLIPPIDVQMKMVEKLEQIKDVYPIDESEPLLGTLWKMIFFEDDESLTRMMEYVGQFYESMEYIRMTISFYTS